MWFHLRRENPVDHAGRINQLHAQEPVHNNNHSVFTVTEEIKEALQKVDLLLFAAEKVANQCAIPLN